MNESQVNIQKVDRHTLMSDAFYRLDRANRNKVRQEICDILEIKLRSFYYRLDGFIQINKAEMQVIEEIFRNHGVEISK